MTKHTRKQTHLAQVQGQIPQPPYGTPLGELMDALTHPDTFLRPEAHLPQPLPSHTPVFPTSPAFSTSVETRRAVWQGCSTTVCTWKWVRYRSGGGGCFLTIRLCVCVIRVDRGKLWAGCKSPQGFIARSHLPLVLLFQKAVLSCWFIFIFLISAHKKFLKHLFWD